MFPSFFRLGKRFWAVFLISDWHTKAKFASEHPECERLTLDNLAREVVSDLALEARAARQARVE